MPEPSFASQNHHGIGPANTHHWVLAPVRLDRRLIAALHPISAEGSALYLEGQQLSLALRDELASLTEYAGTVIPAGTGWCEDWYFRYRLRQPADALDLVAKHGEAVPPSLVDHVSVLSGNDPLWAWQRDRGELLLAGRLSAHRVTRIALVLEKTPVRRDPGA